VVGRNLLSMWQSSIILSKKTLNLAYSDHLTYCDNCVSDNVQRPCSSSYPLQCSTDRPTYITHINIWALTQSDSTQSIIRSSERESSAIDVARAFTGWLLEESAKTATKVTTLLWRPQHKEVTDSCALTSCNLKPGFYYPS